MDYRNGNYIVHELYALAQTRSPSIFRMSCVYDHGTRAQHACVLSSPPVVRRELCFRIEMCWHCMFIWRVYNVICFNSNVTTHFHNLFGLRRCTQPGRAFGDRAA